jgi:hypothetical protein
MASEHVAVSVMLAGLCVGLLRAAASVCRTLPQGYGAAALLPAATVLRGSACSSKH